MVLFLLYSQNGKILIGSFLKRTGVNLHCDIGPEIRRTYYTPTHEEGNTFLNDSWYNPKVSVSGYTIPWESRCSFKSAKGRAEACSRTLGREQGIVFSWNIQRRLKKSQEKRLNRQLSMQREWPCESERTEAGTGSCFLAKTAKGESL